MSDKKPHPAKTVGARKKGAPATTQVETILNAVPRMKAHLVSAKSSYARAKSLPQWAKELNVHYAHFHKVLTTYEGDFVKEYVEQAGWRCTPARLRARIGENISIGERVSAQTIADLMNVTASTISRVWWQVRLKEMFTVDKSHVDEHNNYTPYTWYVRRK